MGNLPVIAKLAIGVIVVGGVAGLWAALCVKTLSFRAYVAGILLLAAVTGSGLYASDSTESPAQRFMVSLLCVGPVVGLFLVFPGIAVRDRAGPGKVFAIALAAAGLASPLWVYWVFWAACAVDQGSCL